MLPVKKWWRHFFWGIAIAVMGSMSAGCRVHLAGLVSHEALSTHLTTMEGERYRLVLGPETSVVRYLDGIVVDVWGPKLGNNVRVRDWKAHQGGHGMAAWVGKLEYAGIQIGLTDRNSGS